MKVSPATGARVLRALKALQTKPLTVKELLSLCATRKENADAAELWKALQRATGQQSPQSGHVGAFFRDNSDLKAKPLILTRPWSTHSKQKLIYVETERQPEVIPPPVPVVVPPVVLPPVVQPTPEPPRPVVKFATVEPGSDKPAEQHAMRQATAPTSGPTHQGAPIISQPERARRVPAPMVAYGQEPERKTSRFQEIERLIARHGLDKADPFKIIAIDRIRTARGQSLWQVGMSCNPADYQDHTRPVAMIDQSHYGQPAVHRGFDWNPLDCFRK